MAPSDSFNHFDDDAAGPEVHGALCKPQSREQVVKQRKKGRRRRGEAGARPAPVLHLYTDPLHGPDPSSSSRPPLPLQPSSQAMGDQALFPCPQLCCHCPDSTSFHPHISRQMCSQTLPAPQKGAWHVAKPCPPFKVTQPPPCSKQVPTDTGGRRANSGQQQMGSNVMSSGTRVTRKDPRGL